MSTVESRTRNWGGLENWRAPGYSATTGHYEQVVFEAFHWIYPDSINSQHHHAELQSQDSGLCSLYHQSHYCGKVQESLRAKDTRSVCP